MSDEPAYQVLFTLPDYNALKRHIVGGGRGQVDIDPSTIAAWQAMCDYAEAHHGCVFAAAVVPVLANEETPKIRGWKEPKT